MKCFVIAMDKEIKPLLSQTKSIKKFKACGKDVYKGVLFGEEITAVVCGVGKANAASGAQYAIDCLGADVIINTGVAGALRSSMRVGQTYAVESAVQYDFDLTLVNGTKIGTLDECEQNYLPLCVAQGYPICRCATGDRFNNSPDDYRLITDVLDADVRDMELGAIAQVCMHAGVKCYAFKTISDIAGSGSTYEQYKNNLKLCIAEMEKSIGGIMKAVKL